MLCFSGCIYRSCGWNILGLGVNPSISLLFPSKIGYVFEILLLLYAENHPHLSVCGWMMDIFDELMVTKSMLRYISIRMSSLFCMSMLRNWIKLASSFVACICVCANDILLLLLLILLMCGMMSRSMSTFISRSKVIEYILFEKTLQNGTKKFERPGDWYEIDEKWHFLWEFLWISEHDISNTLM
jgi:hypothetical protein